MLPSTLSETDPERLASRIPESLRDRVVLEMSEQQLIGDPTALRGPVQALRELGLRVALDDVGFGRSSLEALILLEPTAVKIARRYVTGLAGRPADRRTLSRLVSAVAAVGAEAIPVGVERAEDRTALLDLGIQRAQGWLWDPPA